MKDRDRKRDNLFRLSLSLDLYKFTTLKDRVMPVGKEISFRIFTRTQIFLESCVVRKFDLRDLTY